MPLVIYDKATGLLKQCVVHAESGLERIQKMHDELGDGTMTIEHGLGIEEIMNSYVLNGVLQQRPAARMSVDKEQLKADGSDTINLAFEPPAKVEVFFDGLKIHEEERTEGFPFQVNVPGDYQLLVTPEAPYTQQVFTVKAT